MRCKKAPVRRKASSYASYNNSQLITELITFEKKIYKNVKLTLDTPSAFFHHKAFYENRSIVEDRTTA